MASTCRSYTPQDRNTILSKIEKIDTQQAEIKARVRNTPQDNVIDGTALKEAADHIQIPEVRLLQFGDRNKSPDAILEVLESVSKEKESVLEALRKEEERTK